MIGRDLDHCFIRAERQEGAELLRVEGLTSGPVRDISFNVHRGEVVGLYGLVGSGRTEIAETLFGIRPLESGTIHWDGVARTIRSPRDAIALGIGLVPEDRKHQALVLGLGGSDNLALPNLGRVSRLGVIASGLEGLLFEDYRKRLSISTAGPKQPVLTLSGGNQQKIVIAKWLAVAPQLLILDEPTRGVDVGAKAEIHGLIAKLAESGLAVIVISSEMPEIIGVSHRILTIADGRLTGEIAESDFSEDRLIAGVTGHVWADETPRPQAA
jgi:ribose transport system ATP-binding protein